MVEFLANWLVQGIIVVVAAATLLRLLHRARAAAPVIGCASWGSSLVLGLPLGSPLAAVVWQEEAAAASGAVSPGAGLAASCTVIAHAHLGHVVRVGRRVRGGTRERDRESRADERDVFEHFRTP